MKNSLALSLGLLLSLVSSFAQPFDTSQFYGMNNFLFQHIDKTPINTGLLRDYGIDFQELDNYTGVSLHDSNFTSLTDWRMLYTSVYSQQITSTANMLYLDTLNKRFSDFGIVGDPISFVTLYYNYQSIDPNAQANNQLYMSNNQLYDVIGRTGNPYLSHEVFAVATTRQVASVGNNQFNFRSLLYLSNTGKTISAVEVDALGTGSYQTINIDNNFTVLYDTAGLYNINVKITYTDNSVKYGHTKLAVYGNDNNTAASNTNFHKALGYTGYGPPYLHSAFEYDGEGTTNEVIEATKPHLGVLGSGNITIELSVNNTTGQIRKPLIVIEGFDPNGDFTYDAPGGLLERLNRDLNNPNFFTNPITLNIDLDDINEYDIIFVNYNNGTDFIQRNAFLVEAVIERVNDLKTLWSGVRQQNVIIGMSMGGLVARYALKDMEDNNIDHETRLFISHDVPHTGANVPVAYQALVQYIAPWQLINIGGNFPFIRWRDLFPDAVDAVDLFNSPAAKQMLIQRYILEGSNNSFILIPDNSVHTAFMTELNNLGWPANCKNITLSNGACNGATQFADNSIMLSIDGEQEWRYFGSMWRSLVGTIGGIFILHAPLTLGTVPVNNSALAVQFPLSLISTKTNIFFDFGAWAVPTSGTSLIFKGDVFVKRKLLWLLNSTSYIMKCRVSSSAGMLALDNIPGGVYDLNDFGLNVNVINAQLQASLGDWVSANLIEDRFCFVPTVSALAFNNPVAFYRSSVCNIVNCNNPAAVSNYYAPAANEIHISYTQANSDWILQNQDPSFTCAKLCASNLSISGSSSVCVNDESYTINTPVGAEVVWSLTPANNAFLTTVNGNQILLQRNGSASGTSTLTATITNACGGNIVVNKPITYGTASPSYSICGYDPNDGCRYPRLLVSVNNEYPTGATYNWYINNVLMATTNNGSWLYNLDPGECDNFIEVSVIVTTDCGNSAPAGEVIYYACESGFSRFAASPNPTTGSVQIEAIETAKSATIKEIQVTDKFGNLKKQFKLSTTSKMHIISIADLPADIYIIRIYDGKTWDSKKIIKN